MGVLYADEGDYQTALVYFEKALKLDPHVAEVHGNLSLAYVKTEKIDIAIQHGLQAITLDPAWFKPYHHLGTAFWMKKELQKAARYFREAIDREPKAATSYYSLGLLYIREAEAFADISPRDALSYIEKALALNPSSIETAYFLAQILATHPDQTVRNGARAAQLAEEACKRINYQSPFFLDTLAAAYAEAGRFHDALKTAYGAVALASAQNREELVQHIQERIQLYQAGIPYHRSLTQGDF
jgi:tetratricopeptide (TPR) repeat protein